MTGLSVLTLVKDRTAHLQQMIQGLQRSDSPLDELVVVHMDQIPCRLPHTRFPVRSLCLPGDGLPLAQARNLAATTATHDALLFLDVDCIPAHGLTGAIKNYLAAEDMLICPEIRYLGPNETRDTWNEALLRQTALSHPARQFPEAGLAICDNPGLFWSLAFGIRRQRFLSLGGFDEAFTGYGAEDTDFGFRADRAGLPVTFLGGLAAGIGAFHQHHPVYDPPLQHFADILRNATLFYARWNFWPMQGWLQDFIQTGLITITNGALQLVREPTLEEVNAAEMIERRY